MSLVDVTAEHRGEWSATCSCGWSESSDHEVHLWQLTRQHHLEHWADDPPASMWSYTCGCGWIMTRVGIRSELLAAVTHHRRHRQRVAHYRRMRE